MIERLESFSDIPMEKLPFPVYTANRLPFNDLTMRAGNEKWASIRFFVLSNGKRFRVKEFFLDWFFTGFPKSLLKDFSSSYSAVETFDVGGSHFYYGKNYHGLDSVSGYVSGTQIEVECGSYASIGDFTEVVADLLSRKPDYVPPEAMQFPERSHSVGRPGGEWYENRRISNLDWYRTAHEEYTFSGHTMMTSGIGYLVVGGQQMTILILQEHGYEKAIWAEVAESSLKLRNAIYNVRKGSGFYNRFTEIPGGSLLFRETEGPGILRIVEKSRTWTIGFSPGFTMEETISFSKKLTDFSDFLQKTLESAIQENA